MAAAPYWPPVMIYTMADLSHWDPLAGNNTAVDFAMARAYGVTKLGLKATQGTSDADPTFQARRAAAIAAGIGVCAYAFLDATTPASAQAQWLLQTTGALEGIELAIDVESNAGGAAGTVTIALAADVAQAIADLVGFLPIYYGTRFGPDGAGTGLPNATLAQCPLWLGEWGNLPICPAGWSQWKLWQSTNGQTGSGVTPVPGLGPVDRSYIAASSLAEIDSWWGKR
jgi:lysozyme